MYLKCKDCEHKTKNNRCLKRSFMINEKFLKAWGCDDYKPKYLDLLKELELCESK